MLVGMSISVHVVILNKVVTTKLPLCVYSHGGTAEVSWTPQKYNSGIIREDRLV
jgi:hypothetical protein